ncbi:zeaxanthin epoxidase [Actinidia rufa]|uniref:Zeaxanthin epoxidase n=1 Tax=Actinidia rufa TaxID=165716 RepID=A0A7J0FVZ1_9ERIC|nr:zeaxanthin epoxidase [Actinidia rufa]
MAYFQCHNFNNQYQCSLSFSQFRAKKAIRCEERGYLGLDGKKRLRILIAGGGVGGLVLALAARKRGYDVKVFEGDLSAVRGEGQHRGPIQLLSSALAVLESIDEDVTKRIVEAGCVTGNRINGLADGLSGEWFTKFDLFTPAVTRGLPVTQVICRIALQNILVSALGKDIVNNNSKVVDFVDDSNKVRVILEDGRQYEGDVLVGADGIWSKGVGRCNGMPFMKQAPMNGDSPGKKERLLELFGSWCSNVVTLISETTEDMILQRDIYDRDMIYSWGIGCVTLLGDAAHPMQPNLGQGGCMAIEDCYQLILELDKVAQNAYDVCLSNEIVLALKRYEKKRMFPSEHCTRNEPYGFKNDCQLPTLYGFWIRSTICCGERKIKSFRLCNRFHELELGKSMA